MAKRRTFTAAFKARVAKEALRGDRTVQQIAAKHEVHPNQVSQWKRKASEGLVELFERGAKAGQDEREAETRKLHEKIGQLVVERDFWGDYEGWCPKASLLALAPGPVDVVNLDRFHESAGGLLQRYLR